MNSYSFLAARNRVDSENLGAQFHAPLEWGAPVTPDKPPKCIRFTVAAHALPAWTSVRTTAVRTSNLVDEDEQWSVADADLGTGGELLVGSTGRALQE